MSSSIFEEKKLSASEIRKKGEEALKDLKSQNKSEENKNKKKGSEYTEYLKQQFRFKVRKYEEQKKRQLEKIKEREKAGHLEKAKASISGIKVRKSGYKETDPTVAKKTLENIGSTAAGVAGAAYHGARYLLAKRKANKKAKEAKERQQEKKSMGDPGRPKKQQKPSTVEPKKSEKQKILSGTPDRPKLVPSTKRLPPSGGVPSEGQRARKNPALKAALIKKTMGENFSNWREELLIEVKEEGK